MTPNKPDPTNGEEKMRDELRAYTEKEIARALKDGDGNVDMLPFVLAQLKSSHLALLEQIIGENESHRISADVPTSLEVPEDVLAEMHRDMKQFRNGHSTALDQINTDLRAKIEELKKQQL